MDLEDLKDKIRSSGFYHEIEPIHGDIAYDIKKEYYDEFAVYLNGLHILGVPSKIEIEGNIVNMYLDISEVKKAWGWKEPEDYSIDGGLLFIQFKLENLQDIEIVDLLG